MIGLRLGAGAYLKAALDFLAYLQRSPGVSANITEYSVHLTLLLGGSCLHFSPFLVQMGVWPRVWSCIAILLSGKGIS